MDKSDFSDASMHSGMEIAEQDAVDSAESDFSHATVNEIIDVKEKSVCVSFFFLRNTSWNNQLILLFFFPV